MSRFLLFWLCPHPEGHCGPESRQVSPGLRGVARTSPGEGDKLPRESFGSPWSPAFPHGVGSKDTSQKEVWRGSHGRNSSALFHLRSLDHHRMD